MKEKVLVALCFFLIVGGKLSSQTENKTTGSFTIEWEGGTGTGSISATNGKIARIEAVKGNVRIDGNAYRIRNASGADHCSGNAVFLCMPAYGFGRTVLCHCPGPRGSWLHQHSG